MAHITVRQCEMLEIDPRDGDSLGEIAEKILESQMKPFAVLAEGAKDVIRSATDTVVSKESVLARASAFAGSIEEVAGRALESQVRPFRVLAREAQIAIRRRVVTFDPESGYQQEFATEFRSYLSSINFNELYQKSHSDIYGKTPISDTIGSGERVRWHLSDDREMLAVLFFSYGKTLTQEGVEMLFGDRIELLDKMEKSGLALRIKGGVRLNDVNITPHKLPNGDVMYLFADLPARLRSDGMEAEAELSTTSYVLLNRLEEGYKTGDRYAGVVADFGSGVGIQAIALVMLNRDIDEAICLEINERSMNFNRFNAMLNGASDRIQVVDNMDTENFTEALKGRKISLAVSNPPFNTVPHEFEERFPPFGYGGDYGMDITKIFFDQAIPVMEDEGEFIFYSVLPSDYENKLFLSTYLIEKSGVDKAYGGLTVNYDFVESNEDHAMPVDIYAKVLALAIINYEAGLSYSDTSLSSSADVLQLAQEIRVRLKEDSVDFIIPVMTTIVKDEDESISVAKFTGSDIAEIIREIKHKRKSKASFSGVPGREYKRTIYPKGGVRIERIKVHRGGVFERTQRRPNLDEEDLRELAEKYGVTLEEIRRLLEKKEEEKSNSPEVKE